MILKHCVQTLPGCSTLSTSSDFAFFQALGMRADLRLEAYKFYFQRTQLLLDFDTFRPFSQNPVLFENLHFIREATISLL